MEFTALQKDMVAAMKAKDKVRKDAVSSLVSAAKKWQSTREAGIISRKKS